MRFFRAFLPNVTICLNIALLIVIYLDRRNPMMGFLVGAPFMVLAVSAIVCSVATAIILYAMWRKQFRKGTGKYQKVEIDS